MVAQIQEFEMNINPKRVTYFYCYNPKLRKFLGENGLSWIDRDINPSNGFPYWTFAQSTQLGRLIKEYNKARESQTTIRYYER